MNTPPISMQTEDHPSDAPQQPGGAERLGRYQIRRELGRGFSSIVFEAEDLKHRRTVALKVLTFLQNLSPERREDLSERFDREARAISALSHPGIVAIYEVGHADDGREFIAMEHLRGETLRDRLQRERSLPPEEAVAITLQVAAALQYAHGRGIIHRDVKPDNVFVLADGRVKLMDFGVAHVLSDEALTRTGMVVGSPAYMSPEQISGDRLDGRSDVFSLGVMLAEMAAGHRPFEGATIPAVMNRILSRPPQIEFVTPRALRRIIEKSLSKSRQARFQSAAALADALHRQVLPRLPVLEPTHTLVMPASPVSPVLNPRNAGDDPSLSRGSHASLWFARCGLAALMLAGLVSLSVAQRQPDPATGLTAPAALPQRFFAPGSIGTVRHIPLYWHRSPTSASLRPDFREAAIQRQPPRPAEPVHATQERTPIRSMTAFTKSRPVAAPRAQVRPAARVSPPVPQAPPQLAVNAPRATADAADRFPVPPPKSLVVKIGGSRAEQTLPPPTRPLEQVVLTADPAPSTADQDFEKIDPVPTGEGGPSPAR